MKKTSKASGPHGTAGGNGGYSKRRPVKTTKNPQKTRRPMVDYTGRDVKK